MTLIAYISLGLSLLLLWISAFMSSSEVAFFALSPKDHELLEDSDDYASRCVRRLLQIPEELLATILIGNNFVNIVLILLLSIFTGQLLDLVGATALVKFLVESILITFLLLLFGEIIPKISANQDPLRRARRSAPVLLSLTRVLHPLCRLLIGSTSVVNNRLAQHAHANLSMEEIEQALELTSDTREEDKDMLEGIINFGNIDVADIMCPRVDMVDLDIKSSFADVLKTIIDSGYSRIPVYSGTIDRIKGILYSKDLLPHLDKPNNFRWQTLIRSAYFVPESKKIDDLLHEFQEQKVHLAIVVDEYGGTSGLITMEDILEEIVGDINDEYDEEEKNYQKLNQNTYIFDGKMLLQDFYRIVDVEEDFFADKTDDVETLAGLLLEMKGEFPRRGEQFRLGPVCFEVMSVDKRRIKRIKATIHNEKNSEDTGLATVASDAAGVA